MEAWDHLYLRYLYRPLKQLSQYDYETVLEPNIGALCIINVQNIMKSFSTMHEQLRVQPCTSPYGVTVAQSAPSLYLILMCQSKAANIESQEY